jgi:micrococcal nuclease
MRLAAAALLAAVGLALTACAQDTTVDDQSARQDAAESIPQGTQAGVVERVVDGDTIWVRIDEPGGPLPANATHKIRLLEIDTPEVAGPGGVQCGGREATAFAERHLLLGSTVHLLADREDTDRYGRFLRYVWTDDGMFFNAAAVRSGHARAVLYEPNDAYIDLLRAAEAEARREGRGIWGEYC